jgi:competence protein ComEA
MQNIDRPHANPDRQTRRKRSGPTDEGQGLPSGQTTADTQGIDLNHATWQQLMGVEGMTEVEAHAIIEDRTHLGHFTTWQDVLRVPGISETLMHNLQHSARIGGSETRDGKAPPTQSTEPSKKP